VRSWCRPSGQSPAHPTPVQALWPSDQFFRKRFPTKPGLSLLITLGRRLDLLLDSRSVRCRFPRSRVLATLRICRQFGRNPSKVTQYRGSAHSMLRVLMVHPLLRPEGSVMGGEFLKESDRSSPSILTHGRAIRISKRPSDRHTSRAVLGCSKRMWRLRSKRAMRKAWFEYLWASHQKAVWP